MTAAGVRGSRGPWWEGLRRFRRNRAAAAAVFVIVALALVAIFADAIAPYGVSEQLLERSGAPPGDPLAPRSTGKFEAPSLDHLFGTDQLAVDPTNVVYRREAGATPPMPPCGRRAL